VVGADDALVVDDDRGPVRDARVLLQHAEGAADGVVGVADHGMRDLVRERLPVGEPGLVAEERVGADADDLDLVVTELLEVLLEAPEDYFLMAARPVHVFPQLAVSHGLAVF
jgi:hypothetical protein